MTEPIDLVIPMVFPEDKEWQRDYARTHGAGSATTNVRFRSWQTEELLVRCCMKYMPWLRRIHILLARESQVQPWMEKMKNEELRMKNGPSLRTVFHREFIPAEYLPCFTSPCIEMFIGRIPGLSEHFIYANDDMFPLSPLEPADFFREATGRNNDITEYRNNDNSQLSTLNSKLYLPCQHLYEKPVPAQPNMFKRKCRNQQNMIGRPFGQQVTTHWLKNGHSYAAILKSTCDEVWRRHGPEILKHISPLERTDHSYSQYIYVLYQHYAGLYIDHAPQRHYAGPKTPTADLASIIRDPQAGIVCLNDNEKIADWQRRAEIARREITAKLQKGGQP